MKIYRSNVLLEILHDKEEVMLVYQGILLAAWYHFITQVAKVAIAVDEAESGDSLGEKQES